MLGVAYLIHFIYKIVHFEYVQLKAYGERVALFCSPPVKQGKGAKCLVPHNISTEASGANGLFACCCHIWQDMSTWAEPAETLA